MIANPESYSWTYYENKKGIYYAGLVPNCCIDGFSISSRRFIGFRSSEVVQLFLCQKEKCMVALLLLYPYLHTIARGNEK